jgi:hypothetical protein
LQTSPERFDALYGPRRVNELNERAQASPEHILELEYGSPFPAANAEIRGRSSDLMRYPG